VGKYFKESEFKCHHCGKVLLDDNLIPTLDAIREIYGKKMVVASGYRCPEYNETVGGVRESEHTEGKAADIVCANSLDRFALISACLSEGITRLGIGKTFIHIGISNNKPLRVIWLY
jgi:uncharacterized protein YcbK (DUF882 family)